MTLRGLIFIALRFYAITFFMQVIPILPLMVSFAVQGFEFQSTHSAGSNPYAYMAYSGVVTPILYLIMALLLWFASGRLALAVAREYNPEIRFNLTREDAFACAFVVLGLYFVLSSVPSAVRQFVRLMMENNGQARTLGDMTSRTALDLLDPASTAVLGLVALIGAPKWARKLAGRATRIDQL